MARWVSDAATDQAARGWDVHVACPASGALPHRRDAGGPVHDQWEAERAPGPSARREIRTLARIIAAVQPDLIHLHSSKAGLVGRLVVRGRRPTVFQPHAWSFEAVTGIFRAGASAWERWATRWAHATVCVSDSEKARGEEVGIQGRWAVIPNGVDLSLWSVATASERYEARVRLGLPDAPIVVCVGRSSVQKGQDVLLASWPAVIEQVPDARLFLVGDGTSSWRGAPQLLPSVGLAGHTDDVPGWLAAADVVAISSRWEGMSLVMLEAMARGRSVVTTEVAGAPEVVGRDAGAVVPVGDTGSLARELVRRLLDPALADAEGSVGRRRVEVSHDLRRSLDAIASLSIDVVDHRMG